MHDKIKVLQDYLGDNRIKLDVDMSEHIQSGYGGKAAAFYIATDNFELVKIINLCRELKLDFIVIGTGTKIVIPQEGNQVVIVKNRSDSLKISGVKGKVSRDGIGIQEALVEVESGASLSRLAIFAEEHGLGGLDIFKSMLGTVGGSLFILPLVRGKAHQVKVLAVSGEIEVKDPYLVTKEDIIVSAVFKLKAKM